VVPGRRTVEPSTRQRGRPGTAPQGARSAPARRRAAVRDRHWRHEKRKSRPPRRSAMTSGPTVASRTNCPVNGMTGPAAAQASSSRRTPGGSWWRSS